MTVDEVVSKLHSKYGLDKKILTKMVFSGFEQNLSLKAIEIGLRMTLSQKTGQHEYFTIEDVMEVTGETKEEIISRIKQLEKDLEATGQDTSKYFIKLDENNLN